MDLKTRAKTRMETDENTQFLNVIKWAKLNPLKEVDIYALNPDERDRLKALLVTLCAEGDVPKNILVSVRPDDYATPINVRVG